MDMQSLQKDSEKEQVIRQNESAINAADMQSFQRDSRKEHASNTKQTCNHCKKTCKNNMEWKGEK